MAPKLKLDICNLGTYTDLLKNLFIGLNWQRTSKMEHPLKLGFERSTCGTDVYSDLNGAVIVSIEVKVGCYSPTIPKNSCRGGCRSVIISTNKGKLILSTCNYPEIEMDDYFYEGLGKTIRNISCEEFDKETDDYFLELYLFSIELIDGDDFSAAFTVDSRKYLTVNFVDVE